MSESNTLNRRAFLGKLRDSALAGAGYGAGASLLGSFLQNASVVPFAKENQETRPTTEKESAARYLSRIYGISEENAQKLHDDMFIEQSAHTVLAATAGGASYYLAENHMSETPDKLMSMTYAGAAGATASNTLKDTGEGLMSTDTLQAKYGMTLTAADRFRNDFRIQLMQTAAVSGIGGGLTSALTTAHLKNKAKGQPKSPDEPPAPV